MYAYRMISVLLVLSLPDFVQLAMFSLPSFDVSCKTICRNDVCKKEDFRLVTEQPCLVCF